MHVGGINMVDQAGSPCGPVTRVGCVLMTVWGARETRRRSGSEGARPSLPLSVQGYNL